MTDGTTGFDEGGAPLTKYSIWRLVCDDANAFFCVIQTALAA